MVLYSKKNYDGIIDKLKKEGYETNGTYEFVGKGLKTSLIKTEDIIEMFNLDKAILNEFVKSITWFETKRVGPYQTDKYFLLLPDLKEAFSQLKVDNPESRRCVINFPKEHCFQSIQFLVRENTINVVCFMRSCDVIKNLPYDIWLCSFLADKFGSLMSAAMFSNPYTSHKITMSFGSLHVYKEDLSNVL